jgi:hypothetical protein
LAQASEGVLHLVLDHLAWRVTRVWAVTWRRHC